MQVVNEIYLDEHRESYVKNEIYLDEHRESYVKNEIYLDEHRESYVKNADSVSHNSNFKHLIVDVDDFSHILANKFGHDVCV